VNRGPGPLRMTVMQRRFFALIAVLALALGIAACSSSSKSSSSSSSGSADITISGTAFTDVKPVKAGATVTVKNEDPFAHTVTADNNEFNTDNIDGGKTVTFTAPSTAGTYKFHCKIHSSMQSTLTVTA
jgi:plastocyanin